jgi:hypothetical protein
MFLISLDAYLAALSQDDPKNSLFPLNAAVQPITQTPSNQQPFSSTGSRLFELKYSIRK